MMHRLSSGIRRAISVFSLSFCGQSLWAEQPLSPAKELSPRVKERFFVFGLSETRNSWYGSDGFRLLGSSTQLSAGYGSFFTRGLIWGQAEAVVGPIPFAGEYAQHYAFHGFSASITTALTLAPGEPRAFTKNAGPRVGVAYTAINGKPLLGSAQEESSLSGFSLEAGFFYSWLQAPRFPGNTPELLLTRLDGVLVSVVGSAPLYLRFQGGRLQGSALRFAIDLLISP